MYQALYRKYRPRTFDEVAGQEHITETLKHQVSSGRLSHAYLFIGTRGTGKTTCAKILAKAVNCEHPVNGNPCNACAACRGIDDGSVLDVVEIDAASNNSVDNVRALRDEAVFSPASVKKRVYIIDEVHMLSTAAFNALLKILEEPPEHLMFILATTELRKVPATILSRCQRYSFRRIGTDTLAQRLHYIAGQENLNLTPDAAALLARLADGSFRDGISLLDQCSGGPVIDADAVLSALGLAGSRRTAELLDAVARRDADGALAAFGDLWQAGKDPAGLLSDLCALMRDVMLVAMAPENGSSLVSGAYDPETLRSFAGRFTTAELLRDMERAQEALAALRDSPSARTTAEVCLVSLCDPRLTDGLPELRARVARLEAGLPAAGTPAPTDSAPASPRKKPAAAKKPAPAPVTQEAPPPEEPPMDEAPTPEAPPWDEEAPPPEEPPMDEMPPEEPPADEAPPLPEEPPMDDGGGNEASAPAGPDRFSWEALTAALENRLPIPLFCILPDPLQVTGELKDGVLELHLAKSFAYGAFNKPDILAAFREAASKLAGRPVRVAAMPMDSMEKIAARSIDELARFKEVKFI